MNPHRTIREAAACSTNRRPLCAVDPCRPRFSAKERRDTSTPPADLDCGMHLSDDAGMNGGDRHSMNLGLLFFTLFGLIIPVVGIVWILRSKDR
ncbi:hypothetical protein FV226_21725 [Methylobacterium sp. WL12]|uniref:hypothetical protein n=1 Tax=Methylobacterium sp. WL12 TaxID=2603890 RepID=UPI0011CAAD7F|nr:hypothetical protein [Methylobacterium sp. WL12]TXM67548.1 hypothetical protein FV226_21725 [Methylobacterium sp. WL12]